jgi:CheY-like chemotaxis protein
MSDPLSILITDDQESVTELISRYLREHDLSRDAKISVCRSIDEVWKFFDTGASADVAFIDLVIPPMGAAEVIACIPRLKTLCPIVVVISGFPQYEQDARAAGADDFVNKLSDMSRPDPFFEKVAKYLRRLKGPSIAAESIQKLREIIHPPDQHGQ